MSDNLGVQPINKVTCKKGGIYFIYNENKELMYIGKSVNIKNRLSQHIGAGGDIDVNHNFVYADYIEMDSEKERVRAEIRLINQLRPPLNRKDVTIYKTKYYSPEYNRELTREIEEEHYQRAYGMTIQQKIDESLKDFYL